MLGDVRGQEELFINMTFELSLLKMVFLSKKNREGI